MGNHFSKKTLSGKSAKFFQKGLKMMFVYQIKFKMDQKGHLIDQKRLKMHEKKTKNGVSGPKIPAFLRNFP